MLKSTMKMIYCFGVLIALAGHAAAQDYVGRAHSSCAPLDGTARYGPCMTQAVRAICDAQAVQTRPGCYRDFERYFYAKAEQAQLQRLAMKADVERRIERLRAGAGATGHCDPMANAGRTLDDGLPDAQPCWGTGGDPYAHLAWRAASAAVHSGVAASLRVVDVSHANCPQMASLAQAVTYLNNGATQLDADGDGKPCEEKFKQ